MEDVNVSSIMDKTKTAMTLLTDKLQKELSTLRTGRANPQLIENIKVEHYGTLMPIKQLGAITIPDARTIEITPWDATALEPIEKALQKADMGSSPVNDGKLIRLSIPQMTEERRKELVKIIKGMIEDSKVKVRNERRTAIGKIEKSKKLKEISEDDEKRFKDEIQKLTDSFTSKVDDIMTAKEKEIMSV